MNLNIQAIKAFLVTNNGALDKNATIKKFSQQLELFETLNDINHARIASAVSAVFDKWKGVPINKDGIISFCMAELSATPDTYSDLANGVSEFISSNTGEKGKAIFGLRRGVGSGYIRWIDWTGK